MSRLSLCYVLKTKSSRNFQTFSVSCMNSGWWILSSPPSTAEIYTPQKTKSHPCEEEHHLNQAFMTLGSLLVFGGMHLEYILHTYTGKKRNTGYFHLVAIWNVGDTSDTVDWEIRWLHQWLWRINMQVFNIGFPLLDLLKMFGNLQKTYSPKMVVFHGDLPWYKDKTNPSCIPDIEPWDFWTINSCISSQLSYGFTLLSCAVGPLPSGGSGLAERFRLHQQSHWGAELSFDFLKTLKDKKHGFLGWFWGWNTPLCYRVFYSWLTWFFGSFPRHPAITKELCQVCFLGGSSHTFAQDDLQRY